MYQRHVTGKNGEEIAEDYLKRLGYKILERNFLCRQGEIDIVALDKNEIVITEVKTRTSTKYGTPAEAVGFKKQKHLYNTAKYYLYKRNLEEEFVRFDVIEVFIENEKATINHIKKAIV